MPLNVIVWFVIKDMNGPRLARFSKQSVIIIFIFSFPKFKDSGRLLQCLFCGAFLKMSNTRSSNFQLFNSSGSRYSQQMAKCKHS